MSIKDRKLQFNAALNAALIKWIESDTRFFNIKGIMGFGKTLAVKELCYRIKNLFRTNYYVDINESKPINYITQDIVNGVINEREFYNYRAKLDASLYHEENPHLKNNYAPCYLAEFWAKYYQLDYIERSEEKLFIKHQQIIRDFLGCQLSLEKWNALQPILDPANQLYQQVSMSNYQKPYFNCSCKSKACWQYCKERMDTLYNTPISQSKDVCKIFLSNIRSHPILNNVDHEHNADILIIDEDQMNAICKKLFLSRKLMSHPQNPLSLPFDSLKIEYFEMRFNTTKETAFCCYHTTISEVFTIDWAEQLDFFFESPQLYYTVSKLIEQTPDLPIVVYLMPNNNIMKMPQWKDAYHAKDEQTMKELLLKFCHVEIQYKEPFPIQEHQRAIFISGTGSIARVCSEFDLDTADFAEFDHQDDWYENNTLFIQRYGNKENWGIESIKTELLNMIYYPAQLGYKHPLFICKKEIKTSIIGMLNAIYGKKQYNIASYPVKGSNEYHCWEDTAGNTIALDSVFVLGRFGITRFTKYQFEQLDIEVSNIDWESMVQTIGRARFFEHPTVPVFLFCDKDVTKLFPNTKTVHWAYFQKWIDCFADGHKIDEKYTNFVKWIRSSRHTTQKWWKNIERYFFNNDQIENNAVASIDDQISSVIEVKDQAQLIIK